MTGLRKFGAVVLLVVGLTVYALLVMRFAIDWLPEHWALQGLFYAVAGIVWIFPARRVMRWMM
ncbi:DUF2842 domain-containing protein [Oceanibacterium hippocampi]|uniref:DUF2842 domain-containing protein n=1 Tax=Oceanibacterium hippocampi TaxID=745714 RepID=A0A1Y5RYB6_9PROT|nr:DUF2842 domain-containing protein [Oceanibacterium hippocampi]SLN28457.1 hypothetical protein OCH7691_00955 [Oceanibacterium hippocampi]